MKINRRIMGLGRLCTAQRLSVAMALLVGFQLAERGVCAEDAGRARTNPRGTAPASRSQDGARPSERVRDTESDPQEAADQEPREIARGRQAVVVEELPPELLELLKQWEVKSKIVKTLNGEHRRAEYNLVSGTVTKGTGRLIFRAPDHGRIDVFPDDTVKPNQVIQKDGEELQVQKLNHSESWICDGIDIYSIRPEDKQFERFPLGEDLRGEKIIDGPFPFLFGLKVDDARRRFKLQLKNPEFRIKTHPNPLATIVAEPRWQSDAQNYLRAEIMLDKVLFMPYAVKLYQAEDEDKQSTVETVYWFEKMTINKDSGQNWLTTWVKGDPFKPNLNGYSEVQNRAFEKPALDLGWGGGKDGPIRPVAGQRNPAAPRGRDEAGPREANGDRDDGAPQRAPRPTGNSSGKTPAPGTPGSRTVK